MPFPAKILHLRRNVLKRVVNVRYVLYSIIVITVICIFTSLPLNKPNFFTHNTATYHQNDRSAYIHKYTDAHRKLKSKYKILLWTPFFGSEDWDFKDLTTVFSSCPISNCVLSYNKSEVKSADVLIFHKRDLYHARWFMNYIYHISYYSLPKYRTEEQIWVLMNNESPVNEHVDYRKFNGVFNWTETYHKASEIHIPYGIVEKRGKTDTTSDVVVDDNRTGVVWIASNCKDHARRQLLVHELQKYIDVDQYGSCGQKKLTSNSYENILGRYKFHLSFENSVCEDYITEKFFTSLKYRILPVVYGGGNYKENAPPHSFIDIRDFNNVQDIANYLRYLENNNTAYNEYFKWTKGYKITMNHWCKVCETLNIKKIYHQVYTDLDGWFNAGICKKLSVSL